MRVWHCDFCWILLHEGFLCFCTLGNVLKSKPRKWPRLSVCLMNDEEKIMKTNYYYISVIFFLFNLSSVFLKFLLPDGASFQGKVVPEHLILSISGESCCEIRWLTIGGRRWVNPIEILQNKSYRFKFIP